MVVYTKNEKNLVLPSSLGNFASNGGGGSGVTPAQVQQMIDSSLTEYDETVQGYISGVTDDVEQNKEDIQDLSGTTSALTEGLNSLSGTVSSMGEEIVSLSAQTAQITAITAQIESISGTTEQNSQDIQTISGTTGELAGGLDDLSGATTAISETLNSVSAETAHNAENIGNLSGATIAIDGKFENYTTTAVTAELSATTSGIAVDLATLSAYTETLPTGSTGGPTLYILNNMTQAERLALYNEIVPYGLNNGEDGISSAFPANNYAFYVYLGNGHNWYVGDGYNGAVQLYLDYIHPYDYGGAVFFTGIVGNRSNSGEAARKIRFIIDYQGNVDKDTTLMGAPDVSAFGFSYPDNGRLCYDLANEKFVFTSWNSPYEWNRDVDATGATENIINSDWADTFYDKGIFYASDRNAYATPNLSMTLVSGASVEIYTFPSIYVETLPSQITIDGVMFYKKYYLTYTKKDGSRFTISMLLNSDSKGAQFTYSVA